jgi:hypothetical protein
VLIDLCECTFIGSSVIATLIGARQSLDERHGHRALVIPAGAAALQRVTKITCLGTVLPTHERRAARIAGFERSPQRCA